MGLARWTSGRDGTGLKENRPTASFSVQTAGEWIGRRFASLVASRARYATPAWLGPVSRSELGFPGVAASDVSASDRGEFYGGVVVSGAI